MKRRTAREKAVQTLFQMDQTEVTLEEAMQHIVEEPIDEFYASLVEGTVAHQASIDQVIEEHLTNWTFDRLPKVERTVLRLATFELLHTDVPPRVVIDEAVELCKTFSDEQAGKFVNGVLSKIN